MAQDPKWDELLLDPERLVQRLREDLGERGALMVGLKLAQKYENVRARREGLQFRDLPHDLPAHDLSQTGWGVIFTQNDRAMIKRRLESFLEKRARSAGPLYKEMIYRPGESSHDFLWKRHGSAPGVFRPSRMPYFLLIVGSPEEIPFEFQYQLSINHAVGRLYFDEPEGYEEYAAKVLKAERMSRPLSRRTVFFSPDKEERVLQGVKNYLVYPMKERLENWTQEWTFEIYEGAKAGKRELANLLVGQDRPGLVLVASHGKSITPGHADQEALQGAIDCGDGAFNAEDIGEDSPPGGQVVFLFSCHGVGTPLEDSFPDLLPNLMEARPDPIALRPFVAKLPQTLLRRGTLAVVGHVDRSWTHSFLWQTFGQKIEALETLADSLKQALAGERIGHALRSLNRLHNAIAANLLVPLEQLRNGEEVEPYHLKMLWIASNNMRNLIVLGDPAVYVLGRRVRLHDRKVVYRSTES